MQALRVYDFVVGAETGAQPVSGTPTLDDDLITLDYVNDELAGKPRVVGSPSAASAIIAGTGIVPASLFTSPKTFQHDFVLFVAGSGGVNISASPQVGAGFAIGDELEVQGTSDANYVLLESDANLEINGDCKLRNGSVIRLRCITVSPVLWRETYRNFIGAP